MTGSPVVDASAVVATADKRTASQAKSLFRDCLQVSTAPHLKKVFEEFRAQYTGSAAAHEARPDLILLDLDMPNVSPEELLRQLQASTAEVGTVILASSGEQALRAVLAGAEDY